MNPRNGWTQPPGWGPPHQTGWTPLIDHGPLPLQTARSVGRWLWPTLAISGFLVLTGFVIGHDDPTPGLSLRGLFTIALAAAVIILLTIRRTTGPGPLARALFEYAVVFLLAVLVATTGVATTGVPIDQAPADGKPTAGKQASNLPDQRPALVKTIDGFGDWLSQWRDWARSERDRRDRAAPTTLDRSRALAPSPTPSASTRSPL